MSLLRLAAFLLAACGGLVPAAAASDAIALWCVPQERLGCGCSVRVTGRSCPNASVSGQPHFFSALQDGAPLWLNVAGREMSLPSARPQSQSFTHARGSSWRETYRGNRMVVRVSYRPGRSTCPKERTEGCEYFDVAATVLVTSAGGATRKFSGTGACGC
jgi:hypothetical protein